MASLGRLTNAFLQVSQETTLTLASANFDFALFKFNAPEEYRGLGEALSARRKQAAEDGSIHRTARKLTALFQSIIPPVPKLIHAYGVRASEIAALPHLNPQGTARQGIFADHIGADGTSIWASATSGKNAVTIHLLACFLASIWPREQAIPIWTELVEQRKALLHTSIAETDGSFQVPDLAASCIEVSRSELDEWDSSARSWLQTADMGQKLRQTQLRLIVDNFSLPVSTNNNMYSAITDAWKSAMLTLESLINGEPQRIGNGGILLGLSAWHLYPNILLAGTNQHINQADPLVSPGGIITIGLQNKTDDNKGVFWSLPLTQARYYGEPVMATQHAGVRESQVSLNEFMLVVVGSVISSWKLTDLDVTDSLDLIIVIARAAASIDSRTKPQDTLSLNKLNPLRNVKGQDWVAWLSLLAKSAQYYINTAGIERQNLTRLIKYGQRNCAKFLSSRKATPLPAFGITNMSRLLNTFKAEGECDRAVAFLRKWAVRELDPTVSANAIIRYREFSEGKYSYANISCGYNHPNKRRRMDDNSTQRHGDVPFIRWNDIDEPLVWNDQSNEISAPPGPGLKPVMHSFVCGSRGFAAIYMQRSLSPESLVKSNCMTITQLYRCIQEGDISDNHIAYTLSAIGSDSSTNNTYFDSLCAVEAASRIYATLPGALINLQAMSSRVSKAKWWQSMTLPIKPPFNRLQDVMSCIAYFETGAFDVNPEDLGEHTFAVCHSTSIFVASRLLGDPADAKLDHFVERVIGNVGKPGLSFLVTPPDPKRQQFDPSSWRFVAHDKYDGRIHDSFEGTSFHLTFTGYELPLGVGQRSVRDVPAYLLETAVSVYDKDRWVADLDILTASRHWNRVSPSSCSHAPETHSIFSDLSLISVDSWLEILDPPQQGQHAVVRASGNPIARLATAALASQSGRRVLILPGTVCWSCQGSYLDQSQKKASEIVFGDKKLPGSMLGFLDSSPLYGESDDFEVQSLFKHDSDLSESESSDDDTADSKGDSGENVRNMETGVFFIY